MDTLVAQQQQQMSYGSGSSNNGNGLALGSVLDFSDTDTLCVGATSFASDSCDQIDAILNKIDAELISMQSKRTTAAVDPKFKRKPNKMERAKLSEQGVVFDTGDETNSEMKITLEDLARLESVKPISLDKHTDGNDTGLGSGSVNDDHTEDTHQSSSAVTVVGKVTNKTTQDFGADRSRRSSGCSSNLAQHINIRFQQMISDFDDPDSPRNLKQEDQTDLDSIRTEELELEFCKTLITQDGPVVALKSMQKRQKPSQLLPPSTSFRQKTMSTASETDSTATENFHARFQALLDPQNVRAAAVGNFSAPKGNGAANSYGMESNFQDDGDAEDDDEQEDSVTLQNGLDKRYQELIQHSSTNGYLQRPDLNGQNELNSTSTKPKAVNALEKRANSPGNNTWTQSRSQNSSSASLNTVPSEVMKTASNVASDQDDLSEDDRTLDDGSSRLRMELQNQRSLHSQKNGLRTKPVKAFASPNNNYQLQNKIDLEVSIKLQDELKTLQSHIKQCLHARQDLLKEVAMHQDMASNYREEIKVIEHQVKDSRAKAEDARTSLMLMEFQRESVQKQLEHLEQELDEKEHRIQELENSGKKLHEIGFTTEEVTNIISEREELRERLKFLEASVGDHFSTEQTLNTLKENIIAEKKKFRELLNGLQRELERKQTTINELNSTQDELIHKLKQFEKRFQDVEQEKQVITKRHNQESCSAEMQAVAELSSIRDHASGLQQHLDEALEQLRLVKLETSKKDEHVYQLRKELETLKDELNKERSHRDSLVEDNVKSLKAVILEKEMALEAARTDAEKKFTDEYEQEQDRKNIEKQYSDELAAMQEQLTNKDLQLEALSDRLKQQETWVNQLSKRIHEDTYLKYRHLLEEERAKLENDKEAAISIKLRDLHDETERTLRQMNEDLNRERTQSQNYHTQIFKLREELEETKYHCQQAKREKMELVTKMEAGEQEKEHQFALVKEKMELEMQKVVDTLRENINRQEEELERLRKELKERELKEQEHLSESEKYEQGVLDELNQEYHATVKLLKADPARLTNRTCYAWSPMKLNSKGSGIRSILTATLEALKTASDELRQEVAQLRAEVDKYEHSMTKLERERREELETVKAKMQSEKLQALEILKERLIHTRPYPTGFFDVVNTQKMKEQRKRQQDWEQKRSTAVQSSGPGLCGSPVRVSRSSSVASDVSARTVAQLHAKVKQLQMENLTLQRSSSRSCSVPNLSVTSDVNVSRQADNVPNKPLEREESLRVRELELCLQRAESKNKMAEERATKNEQLFNQKLREHSKVQETMTQQTKEMMQLQRAYSQLQHRYPSSPSKSVINQSALKTS